MSSRIWLQNSGLAAERLSRTGLNGSKHVRISVCPTRRDATAYRSHAGVYLAGISTAVLNASWKSSECAHSVNVLLA